MCERRQRGRWFSQSTLVGCLVCGQSVAWIVCVTHTHAVAQTATFNDLVVFVIVELACCQTRCECKKVK